MLANPPIGMIRYINPRIAGVIPPPPFDNDVIYNDGTNVLFNDGTNLEYNT